MRSCPSCPAFPSPLSDPLLSLVHALSTPWAPLALASPLPTWPRDPSYPRTPLGPPSLATPAIPLPPTHPPSHCRCLGCSDATRNPPLPHPPSPLPSPSLLSSLPGPLGCGSDPSSPPCALSGPLGPPSSSLPPPPPLPLPCCHSPSDPPRTPLDQMAKGPEHICSGPFAI
jgi:hypothetical protein